MNRNPMNYIRGWHDGRPVLGAMWRGNPSGPVWLPLTAAVPAHYTPMIP